MNEKSTYTHIKITPPEEEDVVIYAGAAADAEEPASEQSAQGAKESVASDVSTTSVKAVGNIEADSGADEGSSVNRSPKRRKNEGYKETTLEDIKSSKMSTTQIVIIVIAILAVIAFAVYSAVLN